MVWNQVKTVRKVQDVSKEMYVVWNQVQTVQKVQDISKQVDRVWNQEQTVPNVQVVSNGVDMVRDTTEDNLSVQRYNGRQPFRFLSVYLKLAW